MLGWDISHGTLAKTEAQVRKITDTELALLAEALKIPHGRVLSLRAQKRSLTVETSPILSTCKDKHLIRPLE